MYFCSSIDVSVGHILYIVDAASFQNSIHLYPKVRNGSNLCLMRNTLFKCGFFFFFSKSEINVA